MPTAIKTTKATHGQVRGPRGPRSFDTAVRVLKLVADPTRLAVLDMLTFGERNVGDMSRSLEMTQPALSHHLALLRTARLVEPRREGQHNFYALTRLGRTALKAAEGLID